MKTSDWSRQVRRYAPADAHIPRKLGGGILKEMVEQDVLTGMLLRYALAYINPLMFAGDNGRVLGYDNAHGYAHRHCMGRITPEPGSTWEALREKFETQWRQIAIDYMNGS